jgi:4-hydroxy-4-methyl-2-oxoglutarate aldolase
MTDLLPSAAVADASLRVGVVIGIAPPSIVPLLPGTALMGDARPVTHLGSVDVLLETIDDASPGSVLVIDNGGRDDEACVGDLMVLEAKMAGLAGLVIWGRHRDTAQLREIGLPVFSTGARSFGPRRVPPAGGAMRTAWLDGAAVSADDVIVADDDGVLIVGPQKREELFAVAREIVATETAQADRMRAGQSLRSQLDFATYRALQRSDPSLTLRRYLSEHGGAIEV